MDGRDPYPLERLATLERLGESAAFSQQLLDLLERAGWETADVPGFAGGRLVVVRRGPLEFSATGERAEDVIPQLFQEAMRFTNPERAGESVQLQLC